MYTMRQKEGLKYTQLAIDEVWSKYVSL